VTELKLAPDMGDMARTVDEPEHTEATSESETILVDAEAAGGTTDKGAINGTA